MLIIISAEPLPVALSALYLLFSIALLIILFSEALYLGQIKLKPLLFFEDLGLEAAAKPTHRPGFKHVVGIYYVGVLPRSKSRHWVVMLTARIQAVSVRMCLCLQAYQLGFKPVFFLDCFLVVLQHLFVLLVKLFVEI